VSSVDAIVLGLPAALKAAGLNDIKIIGEGPNTTNLQYLASGEQQASIAFPYYEEMYAMVDALARKFSGVPIEPAFDPPIWLLTKDNVPSTTELFPLVVDVKDQFAKLWGVS
jgi:ribose transport system substrate-binding protein